MWVILHCLVVRGCLYRSAFIYLFLCVGWTSPPTLCFQSLLQNVLLQKKQKKKRTFPPDPWAATQGLRFFSRLQKVITGILPDQNKQKVDQKSHEARKVGWLRVFLSLGRGYSPEAPVSAGVLISRKAARSRSDLFSDDPGVRIKAKFRWEHVNLQSFRHPTSQQGINRNARTCQTTPKRTAVKYCTVQFDAVCYQLNITV